jgi:hypothetical protein
MRTLIDIVVNKPLASLLKTKRTETRMFRTDLGLLGREEWEVMTDAEAYKKQAFIFHLIGDLCRTMNVNNKTAADILSKLIVRLNEVSEELVRIEKRRGNDDPSMPSRPTNFPFNQ